MKPSSFARLTAGVLSLPVALALFTSAPLARAGQASRAVQAVIPRAPKAGIRVDGKMDEWAGSFALPVNAGHADWQNRAAVWEAFWDETSLYVGLRCLDEQVFNAARSPIYAGGDGVEFYLDTRAGDQLGGSAWAPGTVHLHYTPATDSELKARIQVRPGIEAFKDLKLEGVEIASSKSATGYEVELRLPWKLFPAFEAAAGKEIGIDLELCSGDGGPRIDRCWVFSSAGSVQSPAVFGRVRLVDSWGPADVRSGADVLFPALLTRGHPADPRTQTPDPALLVLGVSPSIQAKVSKVELTVSGRALPMTTLRKYGPGWLRVQTCLVGFTRPEDKAVHFRALTAEGEVVAERDVPLAP